MSKMQTTESSDIIDMHLCTPDCPCAVNTAWLAYLAARDQAEHSRDIADGIKAGKAWAAWLALFEGDAQ